jgi:hypothetical protein
VATGIVMVPLLEHYAFAAVLITAVLLRSIFFVGLTSGNPLTAVLVLSFTLIPVAGVAEQALVSSLSVTLAIGIGVGVLVSAVSHSCSPIRRRRLRRLAPRPAFRRTKPHGSRCVRR